MSVTYTIAGQRAARQCFPNWWWSHWPAAPFCRRPGSAGRFHLVQEGPAPRGLPGGFGYAVGGAYPEGTGRTEHAWQQEAAQAGSRVKGRPVTGGFVTGSDAVMVVLPLRCERPGGLSWPVPATPPWSSGSQHRVDVSVPQIGSDIGAHLRPWYLRNGAGRSMLTKAISDSVALSSPPEHALYEAVGEPVDETGQP